MELNSVKENSVRQFSAEQYTNKTKICRKAQDWLLALPWVALGIARLHGFLQLCPYLWNALPQTLRESESSLDFLNARCTCLEINDCTIIVDHFYIALFSALRQTQRSSNPLSLSLAPSLFLLLLTICKRDCLVCTTSMAFPCMPGVLYKLSHCRHHLSHFLLQLPRQIVFNSG